MAIDRGIRLISYLKFFTGILLMGSGAGLMKVLQIQHSLDEQELKQLSIGSFLLAGISLTEGSALLLQKRWAKFFTLAASASLIPFELWLLAGHISPLKVAVVVVNIAIVWYLAAKLNPRQTKSSAL